MYVWAARAVFLKDQASAELTLRQTSRTTVSKAKLMFTWVNTTKCCRRNCNEPSLSGQPRFSHTPLLVKMPISRTCVQHAVQEERSAATTYKHFRKSLLEDGNKMETQRTETKIPTALSTTAYVPHTHGISFRTLHATRQAPRVKL